MQREVEIERRSRLLSVAGLQPTMLRLAVPVGALVTCRSLRAVRCRAAPQVNIVRVFHDVCGPDGCGERTEVHTVPVFTNLDGSLALRCRPPISPDGSRRSKGCGRQLPVTVEKRKPENPTLRPIHPTTVEKIFLQSIHVILEAQRCLLVDVLGLSRRVRGRAVTFLLSFTRV